MNPKPSSRSLPEWVLLVLLALVPVVFSRLTQECFEVPQSALLVTGALALFGLAIAGGGLARARGAILGDPLGASILLFLASALASTFASPNPRQSLHGAPDSSAGFVVACATAAVYFAARSVSRGDARTLERFARAAGAAAGIAAGYALLQWAGLDPLVWGRTASYEGDVRIFGTLGHPNMLGAYLAMSVPLVGWLALRARSAGGRALWAVIGTAAVVTIVATLSRGAWIGLAAGLAAIPLLRLLGRAPSGETRPRLPAAALLIPVGLLALAVAAFATTPMGPHLLERFHQIGSLSAPTTQSRLHIWRAAWRMFQDHPIWGVGLDAFQAAFPRYRTAEYWKVEWGRTPNKAHNEALMVLATQGIAGAIAMALVVALAAIAIVRAVRRTEGPARSGAIAAGAALVVFAAQDMASFTVVALGTLASALAGWLSGASWPAPKPARAPRKGAPPAWRRALAAAVVLALFWPLVLRPLLAQHAEKAALLEEVGTPARADALRRAARLAPWDARYDHLLASSLLEQAGRDPDPGRGRELLRQADGAARRAVSIEPENSYYHADLGRIAAARARLRPPDSDAEAARVAFQEAMRRDPVNAEILDQNSNAMLALGRADEARASSLAAARIYPGLGQPLAFLGYMALMERRWPDAADTLAQAVRGPFYGETASQEAAWSNLSAAYLALGRNEEARRAAEEALALDPTDRDARGNRDLAAQRLGGTR